MSMPLEQQQPPPLAINQQAYSSNSGSGSVGPVIGVLAVIMVLGIIAGMIGRLCSGRRIMGYGQYDFEGWIERKCASCIDGRIEPPPGPAPRNTGAGGDGGSDSVPITIPVEDTQETKQAGQSPQPTNLTAA